MVKKPARQTKRIANRRARYDYELSDSILAGIVLSGAETRSLRMGHGHLRGAYATIKNDELWLLNATIAGSNGVPIAETEQTRSRKLLVSKRQIGQLQETKKQGKTIVPLEILTGGRYIKVRIAIGRGRKRYDKRNAIKTRDESRHLDAIMKMRYNR
jgi:SsrA-binding protein